MSQLAYVFPSVSSLQKSLIRMVQHNYTAESSAALLLTGAKKGEGHSTHAADTVKCRLLVVAMKISVGLLFYFIKLFWPSNKIIKLSIYFFLGWDAEKNLCKHLYRNIPFAVQ